MSKKEDIYIFKFINATHWLYCGFRTVTAPLEVQSCRLRIRLLVAVVSAGGGHLQTAASFPVWTRVNDAKHCGG